METKRRQYSKFVCNLPAANSVIVSHCINTTSYFIRYARYSFSFTSFRTYSQICVVLVILFFSLLLFSQADEIDPDKDKLNVYRYFKADYTSSFFQLGGSEAQKVQGTSRAIKLLLLLLLLSAAIPLPSDAHGNTRQQTGEPRNDTTLCQSVNFKLSRYLRSKLMTRKYDELAPFYGYLTLLVVLLFSASIWLEVKSKQKLFQGSWQLFDYYHDICRHDKVKDVIEEGFWWTSYPPLPGRFCIQPGHTDYPVYSKFLCERAICLTPGEGTTSFLNSPSLISLKEEGGSNFVSFNVLFEPPYFYRDNTSKLLFTSCSLNMFCLLFFALALMSRPKAQHNFLVDTMYLTFTVLSHAALLYNVGVVMHRDGHLGTDKINWVAYSFGSFMVIYFVARQCRTYLAMHNTSQINMHFRRSVQFFVSSLNPALFLYLESKNCKVGGVNIEKDGGFSRECARLAEANFVVLTNIVLGATFFVFFNFTFQDLKLEDFLRCSHKVQPVDIILRFILMGILQTIAMIIFGFRPRDTSTRHNARDLEHSIFIGAWGGPMMASIWTFTIMMYYFKLGHDYHIEQHVGEEDEDYNQNYSFLIWSKVNETIKRIVDRIRVEDDSMRMSPLLKYLFFVIALLAAIPFFLARFFQSRGGENPNDDQIRLILWTVELRFVGDLLLPVVMLYATAFLFSDLSTDSVRRWDLVPCISIWVLYIADTATFFEQRNEFKIKTHASMEYDKEGVRWFIRQVVVCVVILFLSALVLVQKKWCLKVRLYVAN